MLRTRLVTAAVALPSLWLIVWKLPDALFAGFIMAVAAMGLLEYFTMALPGNAVERTAGLLWGLVIAGGVAAQEPKLWGAGLGLAVIGGVLFPPLPSPDFPGGPPRPPGPPPGGLLPLFFPTPLCALPPPSRALGVVP